MPEHPTRGKVSLVGCGPGDIELLTLKAVRCIRDADVIMLDSLANREILQFARPDVQLIDVGKRGGKPSTSQTWIEEKMVELARLGKNVARIKGGDPLVFARGGEELEALAKAAIPVEIVSGITSGIGVPAAAGIPLTHRDYSHQLFLLTGHSFGAVDEPCLPPLGNFKGTLVIYMGFHKARCIFDTLLRLGLNGKTPAAAIQCGTTSEQKMFFAESGDFADKLVAAKLSSPVLLIIGEVVKLSPHYNISPGLTVTRAMR